MCDNDSAVKLYIGNLDEEVLAVRLAAFLGLHNDGQTSCVQLETNRTNGLCLGHGRLTVKPDLVKKLMVFNGVKFIGKPLVIQHLQVNNVPHQNETRHRCVLEVERDVKKGDHVASCSRYSFNSDGKTTSNRVEWNSGQLSTGHVDNTTAVSDVKNGADLYKHGIESISKRSRHGFVQEQKTEGQAAAVETQRSKHLPVYRWRCTDHSTGAVKANQNIKVEKGLAQIPAEGITTESKDRNGNCPQYTAKRRSIVVERCSRGNDSQPTDIRTSRSIEVTVGDEKHRSARHDVSNKSENNASGDTQGVCKTSVKAERESGFSAGRELLNTKSQNASSTDKQTVYQTSLSAKVKAEQKSGPSAGTELMKHKSQNPARDDKETVPKISKSTAVKVEQKSGPSTQSELMSNKSQNPASDDKETVPKISKSTAVKVEQKNGPTGSELMSNKSQNPASDDKETVPKISKSTAVKVEQKSGPSTRSELMSNKSQNPASDNKENVCQISDSTAVKVEQKCDLSAGSTKIDVEQKNGVNQIVVMNRHKYGPRPPPLRGLIDAGTILLHGLFSRDIDQVITRAKMAGVQSIVVFGLDIRSSEQALKLAESYPGYIYVAIGVHPHNARHWDAESGRRLASLAAHPACVAIGECGLDFKRNFSPCEKQIEVFEAQLELAASVRKPLYVHERDAHAAVVQRLKGRSLPPVVIHCFTGTSSEGREYVRLGCYIGVTGYVHQNRQTDGLRSLIAQKHLPLARILLETNSPFMVVPTTYQGPPAEWDRRHPRVAASLPTRMEPCVLPVIAEIVASLAGVKTAEVVTTTVANTLRFLRL